MTTTKRIRNRKALLFVLLIVGVACLVICGFGVWDYLRTTNEGESMPTTEILSASGSTPSEKNPGDVSDDYKVPPDQPRVLAIPSLNVTAYVQRVGIDQDNVMVAPDNIFFAGWYTGSVAPGEEGVSIIDGHVTGKYQDGIFHSLSELEDGNTIRVQMGDTTWREFTVTSKQLYSVEDSAEPLFAEPTATRELRLITCGGVFDKNTQTYDKRLIVTASLVEG